MVSGFYPIFDFLPESLNRLFFLTLTGILQFFGGRLESSWYTHFGLFSGGFVYSVELIARPSISLFACWRYRL